MENQTPRRFNWSNPQDGDYRGGGKDVIGNYDLIYDGRLKRLKRVYEDGSVFVEQLFVKIDNLPLRYCSSYKHAPNSRCFRSNPDGTFTEITDPPYGHYCGYCSTTAPKHAPAQDALPRRDAQASS